MNNIKTFENFNNKDIFTYLKNNDIDQYDLAQLLKNDNFKKVIKKEIKDHLFIDDRYQDLEWYAICKK